MICPTCELKNAFWGKTLSKHSFFFFTHMEVADKIRVQFPCNGCNLKHLPSEENATLQEISNEERALRYALYVNAFVAVCGAGAFLISAAHLPEDMDKVRRSGKEEDEDEAEKLLRSGSMNTPSVNYSEPSF